MNDRDTLATELCEPAAAETLDYHPSTYASLPDIKPLFNKRRLTALALPYNEQETEEFGYYPGRVLPLRLLSGGKVLDQHEVRIRDICARRLVDFNYNDHLQHVRGATSPACLAEILQERYRSLGQGNKKVSTSDVGTIVFFEVVDHFEELSRSLERPRHEHVGWGSGKRSD